jgi:UDP-glucose 4-epimerase
VDLNGKTILVTGSHGHIGSYIVEYICEHFKGCKISCVDNMYNGNPSNLHAAASFAKLNGNIISFTSKLNNDISAFYSLERLFEYNRPDVVFHQASMLTLDSKLHRTKAVNVNVFGSANLFELALKYEVKKVVYASSASVYGNPTYVPTDEDCPQVCNLLYGACKIAVEAIANSYVNEEGLDVVGLRYFNVYGPRQSTSNVYTQIVAKWTNMILDDQPVTIYGDGRQTMDMVYGKDIGRLNVLALDAPSGFYNIGSGIQVSVMELFDMIHNELYRFGFKREKRLLYQDHDPALVKERCADVTKMHEHIGSHEISAEDGIKRSVQHLLEKRGMLKWKQK